MQTDVNLFSVVTNVSCTVQANSITNAKFPHGTVLHHCHLLDQYIDHVIVVVVGRGGIPLGQRRDTLDKSAVHPRADI